MEQKTWSVQHGSGFFFFFFFSNAVNVMLGSNLIWSSKISILLYVDDGHRRSGVSSWRGQCPDPRETSTIQCSKCLLYIIYHQCLLQLYNINVHYTTVCHCVPKQEWQYTKCSMTVFIFPLLHDWMCEYLILSFFFWMFADSMLVCSDVFVSHARKWKFKYFFD